MGIVDSNKWKDALMNETMDIATGQRVTPMRKLIKKQPGRFLKSSCKVYKFNALRLRQNGHQLPDDILKCIFLNENVWISIKISLKFVPKGPINSIPSLVQIMAWRWLGVKPLSEPMMQGSSLDGSA